MERFSCGSKSTPQQGFPGFTPLHTAASDGGTPSAKLGLFKSASKDGRDGASGRSTPSPLPGCEGSAAALEQQQQRLASLTPDSRAKAALQGALDLTPAAEGTKAGERARNVPGHLLCCGMRDGVSAGLRGLVLLYFGHGLLLVLPRLVVHEAACMSDSTC
jgi:hypothetical protein